MSLTTSNKSWGQISENEKFLDRQVSPFSSSEPRNFWLKFWVFGKFWEFRQCSVLRLYDFCCMLGDVTDHIKQLLGEDLRTWPNPRQTAVPIFEIWPPTFFFNLGIWKLLSKVSRPRNPKLKYLSVADLVASWDIPPKVVWWGQWHRLTCSKNRIGAILNTA